MVVVCGKCQRKFNLDDAKIPEGGVRVRCSKCGFTFRVQKLTPPPEEKPLAPAPRPRPAAPSAPAAPPPPAPEPKKAAIIPKDEDFVDIFQPEDSPPAAPPADDEFRDLFSEEEKPKDSATEDAFADIFETSPAEEKAPPPQASTPPLPRPAPEPRKAPEPEGFDVDQMGQEFKLDEFEDSPAGDFESTGAEAVKEAFPPPKVESKKEPETAKGVPEWGTIKFGEEAAEPAPLPELSKTARPEEPAPLPEKPMPAPAPRPQTAPAEAKKAPGKLAEKHKPPAALGQIPNYVLHSSFIVLMLFIFVGVGQRSILKNPVLLKQIGLESLADDLYYRQISRQRQILPFGMKSYWMENQARLPVLVIEGRAFNGTGSPLDVSQFSVNLSQKGGQPLEARVFPIGVLIELEEIRNLSGDELQAQIQKRAVGIHLPPNGEFAFRIPFPGIAIQKINYRIEIK